MPTGLLENKPDVSSPEDKVQEPKDHGSVQAGHYRAVDRHAFVGRLFAS